MATKKKVKPEATLSETAPATPVPEVKLTTYKGFDINLSCRGLKYKVGKTYEHKGKVEACASGFHACEHPLNVFAYYPPATGRYARVIQSGDIARHGPDTKVASARITIEAELNLTELIHSAVKWVFDRAKWAEGPVATGDNEGATASGVCGAATASGVCGAATASGTRGAATASGYQGAATASGYQGAATASGVCGAATASGDQGAATASGTHGAATASGVCGKARGKDGSALFLVNRDWRDGTIRHVKALIVGQDGIKPDTFYMLSDAGEIAETE